MAVDSRRLLVRVWLVMVPAVAGLLLGLLTAGSPATAAPATTGSSPDTSTTTSAGSATTSTAAAAEGGSAPGTATVGQAHDQATAAGQPDAVAYINAQNTGTVEQVSVGGSHTCAVTTDGFVYCWGENGSGRLGNNSTEDSKVPVEVVNSADRGLLQGGVVQVSAGGSHTCAVTTDGYVYCWGKNENGRLGNGNTTPSGVPVQVASENGFGNGEVSQVSAGQYHTCAVTGDISTGGTLYCWGGNDDGRLGNGLSGSENNSSVPVLVVNNDERSFQNGKVSQVSAGGRHTCAVTTNTGNTVYCWGSNYYGQLGNNGSWNKAIPDRVKAVASNSPLSDVEQVSAGQYHTCAVTGDIGTGGTVFCWGRNNYGQLGNGNTTDSNRPVAVVKGDQGFAPEQVSQVSAGYFHSCAVTTDSGNTLYCWGRNNGGKLGNGGTNQSFEPVQVLDGTEGFANGEVAQVSAGDGHTCAVTEGNTAYCWGYNGVGQLGTISAGGSSSRPVLPGGVSVLPGSVELGAVDVGGVESQSVSVGSTFFGDVNVRVAVQDGAKGREFFSFDDASGCGVDRDGGVVSGVRLPAVSSCEGVLEFVPGERGSFGGVVSVTPEVAGSPDVARTVEVAVTGTGVQGELQVPESVDFEVPVGSSKSVSVQVSNPSVEVDDVDTAVPVTIEDVELAEKSDPGFRIDYERTTCVQGAKISVGSKCLVEVVFEAGFDQSFLDAQSAVLTVASDAANGELQVPVEATGTRADIEVNPNPVTFDNTLSDSKTVQVSNAGEAPLVVDVDAVKVTGQNAGLFTVDASACKDKEIKKLRSCTMTVGFAGEDEGSFAATLVIPSNAQVPDGDNTPPAAEVGLSATTPAAVVKVKGEDKFQVTGVGSATTQTVTVVNEGDSATTVTAVDVSGDDFRLTNSNDGCMGKRLGSRDTCDVDISFEPTTDGDRAAVLQVKRQGQSDPDSFELSGEGAYPTAEASVKNFLKVPVGKQRRQTVVVKNTGDVEVRVTKVRGYTAEFRREKDPKKGSSLKGDRCRSRSLQPEKRCRVTVVFAPDQVGPRAATVTVLANTRDPRQRVPLQGFGVAPVVTGEPVDFGDREVGTVTTKTAVITNSGDAPLEVAKVSVTDEKGTALDEFDVANASDCTDRAVKPGNTCEVKVRFFPRDDTQSAAILTVESNAVESPNSLAVSGTGFTVITPDEDVEDLGQIISGGDAKPPAQAAEDAVSSQGDEYTVVKVVQRNDGGYVVELVDAAGNTVWVYLAADLTVERITSQLDGLASPGVVKKLKAPAKKRTANKFTVTWKKPKNIGSAQPDGYLTRITKKGTSKKASRAKTWTKWKSQDWVPAPNGKLSKRFKKLSPSSTYRVQVRAHNVAGNGKKTTIKVTTNRKGIPKKYGTG